MTYKKQLAKELFTHKECNCAQGVLCAFSQDYGIPQETAMQLACGFGGGLRDKEACGAVTGALMALGLAYGQKDIKDLDAKKKTYDMTIEFNKRFKAKHKSIVCRDLINKDICSKLVQDAAQILDDMLKT